MKNPAKIVHGPISVGRQSAEASRLRRYAAQLGRDEPGRGPGNVGFLRPGMLGRLDRTRELGGQAILLAREAHGDIVRIARG